tara:strand:+ start:103 stop:426 length:324 start_codon:yes stop_codon:yes gene_type:complete
MIDKILEFIDTFNIEDLQNFIRDLDLLELLSHPAVVAVCIALGLLSIYRKWRLIIITVLSYTLLYGYLFITFVVIKNSELSSLPTFLMFISAILLITVLGIYKRLIN